MNNLTLRILSSFFLFLLVFFLFFIENFTFQVVIHFLVTLSVWELIRLLNYRNSSKKSSIKGNFFLSRQRLNFSDFLIIIIINLFFFTTIFNHFVIVYLIFFFFIPIFFLLKESLLKLLGIIYVCLPYYILILLSSDPNYQNYLLLILFYAVTTDSSSFIIGRFFKGWKIAPRISPGKTISGSIGGIVIPLTLSLFLFSEKYDSFLIIVITSIIFSTIVQVGDLIESYYKRVCFVKESSNLIPGHGGILDRFDGLALLIVFVYILKLLNFKFYFIV